MTKLITTKFSLWPLALWLCLISFTVASFAQKSSKPVAAEGSLIKLQSIDLGGYAYHLDWLLTPGQSLVRVGDSVVVVGSTDGGMSYDTYDQAKAYRIGPRGRLSFARKLPSHARALAVKDGVIHAIAFDVTPATAPGNDPYYGINTHIETFALPDSTQPARLSLKRKPPLTYTRYMRWITPMPQGILVVEHGRPGHLSTDRIHLLSPRADKVRATHHVKQQVYRDPQRLGEATVIDTVVSLAANQHIAAARLVNERVLLLDLNDALKPRGELKLKGLRLTALSGDTLYAYCAPGVLQAFDVSNPDHPSQLWSRSVPPVPAAKGIVIDGERILIHGMGLTEVWRNNAHAPAYYRVRYHWKTLECIIPNGDLIYAFNGAGSVSKLMTLQLVRPF